MNIPLIISLVVSIGVALTQIPSLPNSHTANNAVATTSSLPSPVAIVATSPSPASSPATSPTPLLPFPSVKAATQAVKGQTIASQHSQAASVRQNTEQPSPAPTQPESAITPSPEGDNNNQHSTCPNNVAGTAWLWAPESCRLPKIDQEPQKITGGITGTITIAANCPVVTATANGTDGNCAPKPYATEMVVINPDTEQEVTRFTSAADGSYMVKLAPGKYTIQAADNGLKSMIHTEPRSITVTANAMKLVNFFFDSGIR